MITKAFTTKKEIQNFKKLYSNGDIHSEVISNLLQPFHVDKYPELKQYCDFWYPKDKVKYGLTFDLQIIINRYGANSLEDVFGKYDFRFVGNRTYKNYILKFEDLIIVAPAKREVVGEVNQELREKLVRFENAYSQFVIDNVFKHYTELADHEQQSLQKMKDAGIIDANNQINFDIAKKDKKLKM